MRKVRSVNRKESRWCFFLFEKEAMAQSHLQIILITERGSLPWETAQWIWLLLQGVLISSSVYKQQSLPTHTLNRMHLTDNHIHREIMIPNQHLCKQCLTRYAQELDGLHLQSFPLWKAWWLGVYGVSPNIVVRGRLASKTDKGDVVTLKQEDSEGSLTVVLQKTIRIKFHTFFSQSNTFLCLRVPKRKCLFDQEFYLH